MIYKVAYNVPGGDGLLPERGYIKDFRERDPDEDFVTTDYDDALQALAAARNYAKYRWSDVTYTLVKLEMVEVRYDI